MNVFELVGTLSVKGLDKAEGDVKQASAKSEKSFDGMERSGKNAASGIATSMGKIGKAVVAGVGAAATAGAAFVGGLMSLASNAQESVEDMGKLSAAFDVAGWSASEAKSTYSGFVGILGETDQAVEASNHLAKLCNNQEELSEWTDIAAGVYATFGDSLPLEGLTEAANETAKCGKVTGPFADALNWTSINADALNSILGEGTEASNAFADAVNSGMTQEDAFNAALATCNSESERAAMVTEIMAGMYTEAGVAYQETNQALIDSRKAQADFSNAMGEAGKAVMPLQAAILGFGTELVTSLIPDLETAGEGLTAMFEGKADGADQFADGVSGMLNGLVTKATEMIPSMITAGTGILQGLLTGILNALPSLVTGIVGILPQLVTTFMEMVTLLVQQLSVMIPMVLPQVVQAIAGMAQAFVLAIPQLVEGLIALVMAIVEMLPTLIPTLLQAAVTLFMALVQALPQIIVALAEAIPTVIQTVLDMLPTFLPMLIDASVQLFMGIVQALPQILEALLPAIGTLIGTGIALIPTFLGTIATAAMELFMGIVESVPKIWDSLKGALDELLDKLPGIVTGFASNMADAAYDMLRGMLDGISNAAGQVWDKITEVCGGALDAVKNFFGIASPSKLMKKMFGYVGQGMALGLEGSGDSVVGAMADIVGRASDVAESFSPEMSLGDVGYDGAEASAAPGGYSRRRIAVASYETADGAGSHALAPRAAERGEDGAEKRLDEMIHLLKMLIAAVPQKLGAEIDGKELLRFLKKNGVVFA